VDAEEERKKALRRIASHKAKLLQQQVDEQGDASSRTSGNARGPGREEPGARAGLSGQVISNLKQQPVRTSSPGRKDAPDRPPPGVPAGAREANRGPDDSKTGSKPEALRSPAGRRAPHAAQDKAAQAARRRQAPQQAAPSRAAAEQDAAPPRAHAGALKEPNAATTRGARSAPERQASAPAAGNLGASSASLLAPDAPAPGSADEVEEELQLLSNGVSGEDAEDSGDAGDAGEAHALEVLSDDALEVLSDDCLLSQPALPPPLASDSSQASVEEDAMATEGHQPQGQEERREEGEEQRGSWEWRPLGLPALAAAAPATSAQHISSATSAEHICVNASVHAHAHSTARETAAVEHRCSMGQAESVAQEAGGAAETGSLISAGREPAACDERARRQRAEDAAVEPRAAAPAACPLEHTLLKCGARAPHREGSDDEREGSVEAQAGSAQPTIEAASAHSGPLQSALSAAVLADEGAEVVVVHHRNGVAVQHQGEAGVAGHEDEHATARALDLRAEERAAPDRLDDRWRQELSLDTSLPLPPSPSSMCPSLPVQ